MQEIYIGNGKNEYHLHSLNEWLPAVVSRGVEGLDGPSMRLDTYPNPGIRGETVAQALPGGSLISLSGYLRTAHLNDQNQVLVNYMAEREAMSRALTHTYNNLGRAQPLLLRFTDTTGRQLQAACFMDRYSAPLELPTHNEWRLQLRNPSGVLESQSVKTVTVGLPKPGGVDFDLIWDIIFTESSGGFATANNAGTTEAQMVARLHGPMINPRLTNVATGEFIGINHTLLAGDVVTIDTRDSSIIQGESTNRMGDLVAGSTHWKVQPGTNDIRLEAETYTEGYAEIDFRDTYTGL